VNFVECYSQKHFAELTDVNARRVIVCDPEKVRLGSARIRLGSARTRITWRSPEPHRGLVSGVGAMAPRTYWKGYLKLSLVSCSVQLFPAISEREKIRFHQIDRKTGNWIKYCKLDAVTGKPINGAPPSITSDRLQTGRTRGPARRAESSIEMAETGTRCVGQGTERDKDQNIERNCLEKALGIGLEEKTFPASDAVAVIEPKPRENRKTDPGGA
jgi:hypothetical protein